MAIETQWTDEFVAKADKLHLHPNSNPAAFEAQGGLMMVRGEGAYLFDNQGNKYFDGISGLISVPLGYSDEKVLEATRQQLNQLPFYTTHFHMSNEPSAKLSKKLAEITPAGINHFTFQSSGSEANETAIKLAWLYWRTKGRPNKRHIISRDQAYHGCAVFTTALSGGAHYEHAYGIREMDSSLIQSPNRLKHQSQDESDEAFGLRAAGWLEDEIQRIGPDNVAAFIGEPIMGAGAAVQIPPMSYWPEVRKICDKYDILLIVDEVMTGFGRVGEWFAQDYFGFSGDIISMSKGLTSSYLPLSATGISDDVMNVILESGIDFFHGFTAAGHPTCCATAIAVIESMTEQDLITRTRTVTGPHFHDALSKHLSAHPLVADFRSAGLFCGLELDEAPYAANPEFDIMQFGDELFPMMLSKGFIIRGGAGKFIIAPPLIAEVDELTALADAFGESVNAYYESLQEMLKVH